MRFGQVESARTHPTISEERIDLGAALRGLLLVELEAGKPVHRLLFRIVKQVAGDQQRTELLELQNST